MNPWVRNGLELGPLIIWFLLQRFIGKTVYQFYEGTMNTLQIPENSPEFVGTLSGFVLRGEVIALAVLVFLSVFSVAFLWRAEGRVPWLPLLAVVILVPMAMMTIATGNPHFIMAKPTVAYVLFFAVLGVGLLFGRNFAKLTMAERLEVDLPDAAWDGLVKRFMGVFVIAALANEALRFWVTRDGIDGALTAYTGFKLPFMVVVTVLFMAAALPLSRYIVEASNAKDEAE